ncbi:MAG: thiamine-phosphate pyrophosphorylase [Candidatus Firestonebacteria bacterium]
MENKINWNKIYRIIDANFNRTREGLRVVEEIARFFKEDSNITATLRGIRHLLTKTFDNLNISKKNLLSARNSLNDVGYNQKTFYENKREDIKDIAFANLRRIQESLRVLEEFSKLISSKQSFAFKKMRFKVYTLEKEFFYELFS